MAIHGYDPDNDNYPEIIVDASGRVIVIVKGQYLATPGTLDDEEYHHLTLTVDKKLRVDDPTTQGKVDDVLALLEDAMEKATGPDYDQDTDSQEAIREVCDSIVSAMAD